MIPSQQFRIERSLPLNWNITLQWTVVFVKNDLERSHNLLPLKAVFGFCHYKTLELLNLKRACFTNGMKSLLFHISWLRHSFMEILGTWNAVEAQPRCVKLDNGIEYSDYITITQRGQGHDLPCSKAWSWCLVHGKNILAWPSWAHFAFCKPSTLNSLQWL